jgi:hypothetical protein
MLSVGIQEATDHTLIVRVVLRSLLFEELDAAFAQCKRHLHAFLVKNEIFGRG